MAPVRPPQLPLGLLDEAFAAWQRREFALALPLFARAARHAPAHPLPAYYLGVTLERLGQPGRARAWLRRALALAGDDAEMVRDARIRLFENDFSLGRRLRERYAADTPPCPACGEAALALREEFLAGDGGLRRRWRCGRCGGEHAVTVAAGEPA